jgi:hypothetical protein
MGRLKPGWSTARAAEHFKVLSPAVFAVTAPTNTTTSTIAPTGVCS